jgi:hypothetical protein
MKMPVPVPSDVLESVVTGSAVRDQQTPLSVTAAPPSDEIFPPEVAVVRSISEATVVVRVGTFN